MSNGIKIGLTLNVAIAMCLAQKGFAQTPAPDGASADNTGEVEEIVVTAQRRSERLQDVPLTVEALSKEQLATTGVNNVTDLSFVVPGLMVSDAEGFAITHLRGIGSTAVGPGIENPIAMYVDGVYYGSSSSSLFDFLNVENVEVLKGPQGTLFGRNATGGLIQVTTSDPSHTARIDASATYGNYQTGKGNLYVSNGITESLAADLAIQVGAAGQGYGTNLANGKDVYRNDFDMSARSKWLWTPSDSTKITLAFDYSKQRNSDNPFSPPPGASNLPAVAALPASFGSRWNISNDVQPLYDNENGGVSFRVNQDLGFANFLNILAYRQAATNIDFDLDASPAAIQGAYLKTQEQQASEEVQLSSKDSSTIKWATGLYYYHAKSQYDPARISFGQLAFYPAPPAVYPFGSLEQIGDQIANSYAAYGQATAPILARTNLTLGIRYTYERHSLTGEDPFFLPDGTLIPGSDAILPSMSKSFDKPTYRVAIDHHLTSDVLLYASWNTGFKSGGYNTQVYSDGAYEPETLTAYEVGAKTEFLGHRLLVNLAAFRDLYHDIQVQKVEGASTGIINGASAGIKGIDLDLEGKLGNHFSINGSTEYLDAKFDSFPNAPLSDPDIAVTVPVTIGSAAGNRMPYTSRWVETLGGNYAMDLFSGQVVVNVTANHVGLYFTEADNVIRQPEYTKLNSSLAWKSAGDVYEVMLWGRNLTNAAVIGSGLTLPSGLHTETLEPPRTYGITVSGHFR
jgi:iron complex outermembrane receptor protein